MVLLSTAKVYLLECPYHIDKMYDYYIPDPLCESITVGSFVTVPFGGGNRKQVAIVYQLVDKSDFDNLKPILSVINDRLSLDNELLGLCSFLKEHTFCTIGDAVRTIIPTAAFAKLNEYYYINTEISYDDDYAKKLNIKTLYIYNYIKSNTKTYLSRIKNEFGDECGEILATLIKNGLVKKDIEIKETENNKYTEYISMAISEEEAERYVNGEYKSKIRSKKQLEIIKLILTNKRLTTDEIYKILAVNSTHLKALIEKEILISEKIVKYRNPYANRIYTKKDENILTELQTVAVSKICELYRTNKPKAVLLHGITGSGKTRVIKAVMDEVINSGRQVIILVPEISLTPQTVDLFCSYYGDEHVAVIHSSLSAGERFDAWKRIRNGDVDIVIGTRSAVFAPFTNVGLIVIDEEQEHTYKSDMTPRYHTKDVVRYRCAKHNALMLLSSATPSLDSYYKAKTNVYTLIELTERYGGALLPSVVIADLREDTQKGNLSPIGNKLYKELLGNMNKDEQSILFINRRGYNNFLSCRMCGEAITCPHCSVSLTYHTTGNIIGLQHEDKINNGYLVCHYCGYRSLPPPKCPKCDSKHLQYMGFGTQRVEEELKSLYPRSTILRMDTDTTSGKFSYEEILEQFRSNLADILLGTQMVTKGHDFENVTLVGVILADSSLYLDDFRANERTFALITQVIGRAGRGGKNGRAIIQTYTPDNETLKLAATQDYVAFYQSEIALRRVLVFPPFCDIALITLISEMESELLNVTSAFLNRLNELLNTTYSDVKFIIFGPFEAPIYKINEKYRMRLIIKCKINKRVRELFSKLLVEFMKNIAKKINIIIDMNPNNV